VNGIPEQEVSEFRKLRKLHNIGPVFIHASYLINLCSVSREVLGRSVRLLVREMELADLIGADYVVLHTGSASQDTADNARGRAIGALRTTLGNGNWEARLLLENTAGERGDISSRIVHLAEIIEKSNSPSIGGICLDTCHAFQAGYEISKKSGVSALAKEIGEYIGLDKIKLIHLNDSKKGFNSGVDRHEHIGQGSIGKEGLKYFINHPAFKTIPLVLETPKKSEEDDPRNLKVVRRYLNCGKPLSRI
ncbi:MAG TPA: deoxyribonuclease IV, partial [Thermodesulfovibrionales bacterium]|nr:deoxyribonuclease IV [Thermodesulfovibrionales bacterium]